MAVPTVTSYTTYADIRAALGVSDDDLTDTTLALALYADHLQTELEDVALTLPATVVTVKAVGSPSDVQTRFLTSVRLFAPYAVAKLLTTTLPVFAPMQVGDGKAVGQRFNTGYKDTIKSVVEQYDKTRNRLIAALAAIGTASGTVTAQVYVSAVAPTTDRVTGL